MEKTRRQIEVTTEVRAKIKVVFKCTEMTIWRALNFVRDTPTCKRIRLYALQNGGKVVTTVPETETIHDADGMMKQYFPNGALLEVNKNTGLLRVFDPEGVKRREVQDCTIQQLYVEQTFAERL